MRSRANLSLGIVALAAVLPTIFVVTGPARADDKGFGRVQPMTVNSGILENRTDTAQVVFDREVRVANVPWIRLAFENVNLGRGSALRITSLADGAVQDLDAAALDQWNNTTAYFNGDGVRLEIVAGPQTIANSVEISEVVVGYEPIIERTQCGTTDDRESSEDPAVGRMLTAGLGSGCTATIYSAGGCLTTAGHCTAQPVLQFNVPASLSNGALQHPGPEDQYMMDTSTLMFVNVTIGQDWGVFQCFENTQTGLNVYEAQQALYTFAAELPSLPVDITIIGYGADTGVDNQTQQVSFGPVTSLSGTVIQHRADTEGGNSGSAILNSDTLEIIGIHTNAGCTSTGGANSGTSIANPEFGAAITAAQINATVQNLETLIVDPDNGSLVEVQIDSGCDTPDTLTLMTSVDGGPFQPSPMTDEGGGLFKGAMPGGECGTPHDFYIIISTTNGSVLTLPADAPTSTYLAAVGDLFTTPIERDMESAPGWSVSGNATTGQWQLAVPNGGGSRGDPPTDYDGSGQCWVTQNGPGDTDIDGGSTILLSETFDMSALNDPYISYARWYNNAAGAEPFSDTMVVEISNNGGTNWVNLETVGPAGDDADGGWVVTQFRMADFVAPTANVVLRFTASDLGGGSVVEAGLDALTVVDVECLAAEVCGDFDNDGDVDLSDFAQFSLCFGGANLPPAGSCPKGVDADCDDDGDVDLGDFAEFSLNFTGPL